MNLFLGLYLLSFSTTMIGDFFWTFENDNGKAEIFPLTVLIGKILRIIGILIFVGTMFFNSFWLIQSGLSSQA